MPLFWNIPFKPFPWRIIWLLFARSCVSYQVTAVKSSLCRQINSCHVAPCCVPWFQLFSNINYESVFLSHHRNALKHLYWSFLYCDDVKLMFDIQRSDWIIEIYSAHTHFDEVLLHAWVERWQDYAVISQIILTGCAITDLFLFTWRDSNTLLYIVMFFKPFFSLVCIRQRCTA